MSSKPTAGLKFRKCRTTKFIGVSGLLLAVAAPVGAAAEADDPPTVWIPPAKDATVEASAPSSGYSCISSAEGFLFAPASGGMVVSIAAGELPRSSGAAEAAADVVERARFPPCSVALAAAAASIG